MKTILLVFVLCVFEAFHSFPLNEHGKNPMEDPELFGGDMLGINFKADRNAIPSNSKRWPGGIIPYVIDSSLSKEIDIIESSLNHIQNKTCIKFVPKTPKTRDYINIYLGKSCNAHVGRIGGQQNVSLGYGCYYLRTIVHELTHAIGFHHEQNRSDRDKYIKIHWENIEERTKAQFRLLSPKENILFNSFDFEGIMLYGPTSFSKNDKITMESITPGKTLIDIDDDLGYTESDVYRINKLYGCHK